MGTAIIVVDPITVWLNQTSVGMRLVNGKVVIRDGALDTKAFRGRPVRRAA
jgi:hypothetical protein